jgi:hypothetical protein
LEAGDEYEVSIMSDEKMKNQFRREMMAFRVWIPSEVTIWFTIMVLLGGSSLVFGLYKLSQHLTIGWQ